MSEKHEYVPNRGHGQGDQSLPGSGDRCLDCGLPGRILAVSARKNHSHDHFIHSLLVYTGPFNRRLDHHGTQFGRSDIAK